MRSLALLALLASPVPAFAAQDSWEFARDYAVTLSPEGLRFVSDEVLVGLTQEAERSRVLAEIEGRGGSLIGESVRLRLLKFAVPAGDSVPQFLQRIESLEGVRYAEPNYLGEGGGVQPDDPALQSQWQLKNFSQSGGTNGADIDVFPAWGIEQGSSDVVIAVLDTGIDFNHPEFAGRLLPGFDFVNEDADPTADHPHGVSVTGLLAANADNGFQVAGVDRACTILPVKVLDSSNGGTVFDLVQGLAYCATEQPDIVNMSLINYPATQSLADALTLAHGAGCILMACAGNFGIGNADVTWPGASPLTISIGATDANDERASFSGTGNALDFVAPGLDVVTVGVDPQGFASSLFSGCSAATPVAAGIVGLLHARYPDLEQDCAYELLREGAEDLVGDPSEDTPGFDTFHGHGRLNAFRSLTAFSSCAAPALLVGSPSALDITAGDAQSFDLRASAEFAGDFFILLGSLGTTPGLPIDGVQLPLNVDAFLNLSLQLAGSSLYPGSVGFLDGNAETTAAFDLPPNAAPGLLGLTLHHAFLVFDLDTGGAAAASNAVPVEFLQTTELLSQDFESGLGAWTFDNLTSGQWHLSPDGECGVSMSQMIAYSRPAFCDYGGPAFQAGSAISEPFVLTGSGPFRVRFDSYRDVDALASTTVRLNEVGSAMSQSLAEPGDFTNGVLQPLDLEVSNPALWSGKTVQLSFGFGAVTPAVPAQGWYVDNVRVSAVLP